MTTDTEALRAQFDKLLSDSGRACLYEGDGQYAYPHDFAWLCYQAGYAAAKAETTAVGARGISLARELRDQADFDEAESVFGGGSRTRELMREAADALHAGAEEHGE